MKSKSIEIINAVSLLLDASPSAAELETLYIKRLYEPVNYPVIPAKIKIEEPWMKSHKRRFR